MSDQAVIPDVSPRFSSCRDEEWLELLNRSLKEPVIDGVAFPRFPPSELQAMFVGSSNSIALGEASKFYRRLKQHASAMGNPLNRTSRILDFGCGWGRYLRFFWKDVPPSRMFGVDVDPSVIGVCTRLGVPGTLSVIEPKGKLPYPDRYFTHVMAYSVFTHLPESIHLHWLREIARVTQTGGTFMLTLEPRRFLDFVADLKNQPPPSSWHESMARFADSIPGHRQAFDEGKLAYLPTGGGDFRAAENYGEAAVPLAFIERHWSPYFKVHEYLDDAAQFWQAILTVQRTST